MLRSLQGNGHGQAHRSHRVGKICEDWLPAPAANGRQVLASELPVAPLGPKTAAYDFTKIDPGRVSGATGSQKSLFDDMFLMFVVGSSKINEI